MSSRISETEYEIMEYFWETKETFTFSELMDFFNHTEGREWKKQTLNTFLKRLINKGLLNWKKEGTKGYYKEKITRAEYEQRCAEEILNENYDGKIKNFIAALSGNENLSEIDEEKLLNYIRER